MCLAIYKPAGKNVPEDHLEEGFQSNRDGAGFAYVENGIVRYMKGFFDYKTFLENYKERVKDEYPAVIHFRWATVGEKNTDNCHPFEAGNGGVLVHNGPQIQKLGDEVNSDSRVFAERIIQPMTPEVITTAKEVLEGYLGYNKVVLLYADQVIILNEDAGVWDDGIWYSNDGYRSWYSYGNWQGQRSSMTQRNAAALDDLLQEEELAQQEMYDNSEFLSDAQIAQLVEAAPTYMQAYIDEHIDLYTYFFDHEAKQWFFYDTSYNEYVHLVTGYAIDEYYEEILKKDYPFTLVDEEDGEEPVEAATTDAAELDQILDTLGRAFEPTEEESERPHRILN